MFSEVVATLLEQEENTRAILAPFAAKAPIGSSKAAGLQVLRLDSAVALRHVSASQRDAGTADVEFTPQPVVRRAET